MPKIVDLQDYRIKAVEQRAFGPWQKRFGEVYNTKTCLPDLSDQTLYILAQPGEQSSIAYYETIMGILDLGPATKFDYLASEEQMRVVDLHLFLADQIRFEMMRRLEWLDSLPCQNISIILMVQEFDRVKAECRDIPPGLAPSHPGYESYQKLAIRDKQVFVRQILREALEKFAERLEE